MDREQHKYDIFTMFACWFQPGLFNQPTVFSSHKKPAPTNEQDDFSLLHKKTIIETIQLVA